MAYTFCNLKKLSIKMSHLKQTRCIFSFHFNDKPFSCIFLIDLIPYRLYITAIGSNPFGIELEVKNGFNVSALLPEEDFYNLVSYLELKRDEKNPFKPIYFFQALDEYIPHVSFRQPRYNEVINVVKKNRAVEDEDKIYFCGWKFNVSKRVSPRNIEKTRSAFGDKFASICVANNISSCWTDIKDKERLDNLCAILSKSYQ